MLQSWFISIKEARGTRPATRAVYIASDRLEPALAFCSADDQKSLAVPSNPHTEPDRDSSMEQAVPSARLAYVELPESL